MFRNGTCVWILGIALALTTAVWSAEAPSSNGPKKQRVSPKLLREAMALPQYAAASPTKEHPPSLERLKQLSEKLKAGGDPENADILQHFIHEHQRLLSQSGLNPTTGGDALDVQYEMIDVNMDDVAKDSILNDANFESKADEVRKECDRLVATKKANIVIKPASISTELNKMVRLVRCHSGGEFPVPVPGTNGTVTSEFREFGTSVELLATTTPQNGIGLQLTCEISEKCMENAITLNGHILPGISKHKTQSTIALNPGETTVHSISWTPKGHRLFLMAKATPKTPSP